MQFVPHHFVWRRAELLYFIATSRATERGVLKIQDIVQSAVTRAFRLDALTRFFREMKSQGAFSSKG